MVEQFVNSEYQKRLITSELISLENGPIDIYLHKQWLRIIDPRRDLGQNSDLDYLIMDPTDFVPNSRGYKGLQDGEEVKLGRSHTHGIFSFSSTVSKEHLLLHRIGHLVEIVDLKSTNGTYILSPIEAPTYTIEDRAIEIEPFYYQATLSGLSVASELHPNRNEDMFFKDKGSLSLGVFDGVSSLSGSELASRLASKVVARNLKDLSSDLSKYLALRALEQALKVGHQAIINSFKGMDIGTTATVAKVFC